MKPPSNKLINVDDFKVEYERFFSVSLDMLCISSYDGHFKKVNPAFEQVLGFSAEELCTKSYMDFIHPDDIGPTTKEVEKQMMTKQQVLNFENRYRCKDGSYRWLSWKSAPVGDFMYAAARDITEYKKATGDLKKTKDSLEVANKELESFSYSVAHDLRAPVRSITSFTTLILEDAQTTLSEEAKADLARVINAGKKMGTLIDGLLNLSNLARKQLARKPVDLSTLVKEISEELKTSDLQRKVKFVITPGIKADGDGTLLKIVMNNLLGNAWKYSSKTDNATIEFGVTEESGKHCFFVRDNGAGFDMQYKNKLFGVFQRLHSEREFEGNGIGLATVQRIIHRHNGEIWATSTLGKGTTFYFTL